MTRATLIDQFAKFRRFLLVGILAAVVDIGGMSLLIEAGSPALLARGVSLPAAMLVAFWMNRTYTFGASGRSALDEVARYMVVNAAAGATSYGVFAGTLAAFPDTWPAIAAALGLGISMWVSFIGFQVFAFRRRAIS